MSNMNRLHTVVENDDDLSLEEMNSESTTINQTNSPNSYLSISLDQSTPISQLVHDERSIYLDELTNERINNLIKDLIYTRRLLIPGNGFVIPIGEAHPWTEESMFDYIFATNHDDQSNDRIAQPSDAFEMIIRNLLSHEVTRLIFSIILNGVPLGVQDSQEHTLVLPVVNTSDRNVTINNENGDINEDATVYTDIDDDLIDFTTNEFYNIHSITAIGAQDNNHIDINNLNERISANDDTSEQISTNDDTSETENYNYSQVSPRSEPTVNTQIHDNVPTNIPTTSILTSNTESSEQVEEIVPVLAGPTDNNTQTTEYPVHLLAMNLDVSELNTHNRKQSNPLNVREETIENKHIQSISR